MFIYQKNVVNDMEPRKQINLKEVDVLHVAAAMVLILGSIVSLLLLFFGSVVFTVIVSSMTLYVVFKIKRRVEYLENIERERESFLEAKELLLAKVGRLITDLHNEARQVNENIKKLNLSGRLGDKEIYEWLRVEDMWYVFDSVYNSQSAHQSIEDFASGEYFIFNGLKYKLLPSNRFEYLNEKLKEFEAKNELS